MKRILRFVLWTTIVLTGTAGYGQELERLLLHEQSGTPAEKRDVFIQLSFYYERQGEYLKAFDYWNKCATLEKEITGAVSEEVLVGGTEALYHARQYAVAIERYNGLLARWKNSGDSARQYPVWLHCIDALDKTGQYDEALNKYSLMITRFAMGKNPSAFVSQLNHMGILEKKKKNLDGAFDYFTNARMEMRAHADKIPVSLQRDVYDNLAVTHAERKEYITSLAYFQKAESLLPISSLEKANLLNLKGGTYLLMGRYEDAQKAGTSALGALPRIRRTSEEQQTVTDSYDLLARLYKDRDWPTYQRYYGNFLEEKNKINEQQQSEDELVLMRSIAIEKKESELRANIAENLRRENAVRQKEIETESMNRSLELKVRNLEVSEQSENLQRVQLEKQLLMRKQAQQQLELEKQRLETDFRQKEIDRQELVQERDKKELQLIRSEKQLTDRELEDAKERTSFAFYIALLAGAIILLSLIGVMMLFRSRRKLIQGNAMISRQKQEIEDQNEEIRKTVVNLETAQKTIEDQNQKLTTHTENLELQVADRTQQLVEANDELTQNNQQLEQYSYMTAHNLRGPIARLLGLTAIFRHLDADGHAEVVDKIQKEAGSLDTLIKDLNKILQVRKATEELSQTIDLGQSVKQAIRILDTEILESGCTVKTDFSIVAALEFVPTYFENIIYNLVSNAIKYRHPERLLTLSIVSFSETKYVGLHVTDNGLGIDVEKNRQNLFGLYKRFHTHTDGKGLGLYLIKAQLETMGGTIHVQSQVGIGTCFTLFFPKDRKKSTPAA